MVRSSASVSTVTGLTLDPFQNRFEIPIAQVDGARFTVETFARYFIHDPVLYVKTAFEDLPRDLFIEEAVNGKTMHRLAGVDAWAAFSATVEHRTAEMMTVSLQPEKELIEEVTLFPVNRGFNSLIEATVHATRYRVTRNPELKSRLEALKGSVPLLGLVDDLPTLEIATTVIRSQSHTVHQRKGTLDFHQTVDLFPLLEGVIHGHGLSR